MFEEITIIGCGLIGSSILRAVKKKNVSKKIVVYDKSKEVLSYLKNKNLKITLTSDIRLATKNADLIIISTPLSAYKEILLSIKDNLKKDLILTDTGSAKKEINKIIDNLNLKNLSWIASHPIAGTEDSGPQAGFADLFENRWCIISPSRNSKKEDVQKLKKFWETIGSKVKVMTFDDHDYILALTSHLPHAVAYNIVKTAISNENKFKQDVIQYSAGGLRDFTRIAASDPIMWRDIFIDNSALIIQAIDKFIKNLDEFKKAILEKDSKKLIEIFEKSKDFRKSVIKAGQDTDKPDFGRE